MCSYVIVVLIIRSRLSTAQASSSLKWLDMRTSTSSTPIFKTDALSCYLTTVVLNDCYSKGMAYNNNRLLLLG